MDCTSRITHSLIPCTACAFTLLSGRNKHPRGTALNARNVYACLFACAALPFLLACILYLRLDTRSLFEHLFVTKNKNKGVAAAAGTGEREEKNTGLVQNTMGTKERRGVAFFLWIFLRCCVE